MSFWLFKPSQLLSSKNILLYKIENFEEVLNVATILSALILYYTKDKIKKELWQKISIIVFSLILFLGFLFHQTASEIENIEGMQIPKYAKFSDSLTIT